MIKSETHERVAEAYTSALKKAQSAAKSREGTEGGSCCAPTCCQPSDGSLATATELADYGEEREKYQEAASSSFGCGNPLAFDGVKAGQTVVDLGSGAGLDLLIASEKVGPEGHVIGVDMTDAMIEAARATASREGRENIEVKKGLIEEMPVDDASVDWVISNCVINLSPDKPAVFREVARVLKPGGGLSVSDIVVEELPEIIRDSAAAYAACIAGAISEGEYLEGLREAGLTKVEVKERLVYTAEQIQAMVAHDLENFGLDPEALAPLMDQVEGKVWSARITAEKA